jgi:bifunctional non-homologous end joining protein LigD
LCALNADGVPVFSRLQAAMDEGRTDQLVFFAFDLFVPEWRGHPNGR